MIKLPILSVSILIILSSYITYDKCMVEGNCLASFSPFDTINFFTNSFVDFEHERICMSIVERFINQFEKENNVKVSCVNGSNFCNGINLTFDSNRTIDIEQARKIMVYCIENLCKLINENKKLRPFLADYPFTVKNIDISFYFKAENNEDVSYVTICNYNTISYEGKEREILNEPYAQAKKKVLGENNG